MNEAGAFVLLLFYFGTSPLYCVLIYVIICIRIAKDYCLLYLQLVLPNYRNVKLQALFWKN